ncbi:unnamed protein product [Leuciscus chuanchicus]
MPLVNKALGVARFEPHICAPALSLLPSLNPPLFLSLGGLYSQGACLPPRVNLSVFFLCRLPRTPGCRYDCLARGLMAPKEEDIKDVCHAPLLSQTSGCELFSRALSPHLIRT